MPMPHRLTGYGELFADLVFPDLQSMGIYPMGTSPQNLAMCGVFLPNDSCRSVTRETK